MFLRVTALLLVSLPTGAGAAPLLFRDLCQESPPPAVPLPLSTSGAVLFLNFDGATITKVAAPGPADAHDNVSFLCGAVVPALDHTALGSDRTQVVAAVAAGVQKLFRGLDLRVVTSRPAGPPYSMVVVGGTPALCGLPAGYSGFGPLDCQDTYPSDVSFVFAEGITSIPMLAVVIAHEAGHSYGLPHTSEACDVMSNQLCPPEEKRFLDRLAAVTPDHKGKCGLEQTNSWALLLAALGRAPLPAGMRVRRIQPPELAPPRVRAPHLQRPLDASAGDGDNSVGPAPDSGCDGCSTAGRAPRSGALPLLLLVLTLVLRLLRGRRRNPLARSETRWGSSTS